MTTTPRVRTTGLAFEWAGNDLLVIDCARREFHTLNPAAAAVWQLCDGTRTTEQIVSAVGGSDHNSLVVNAAIDQFAIAGLMEDERPAERTVLTRRQVLRTAAAGAIAIPLVASISLVEDSALAVTCRPNDSPCVSSRDCCSACCRRVGGQLTCKPGVGQCV